MDKNSYNILIVENELIALEYLKRILLSLGFNSLFDANSSEKALEIIKTKSIDLVFMDINIDGPTDGIFCAHQINLNYPIPIIFTTAYGDSQTIVEASETNSFGYLIKPFQPNDVEANLTIALKRFNFSKKDINLLRENVIVNLGEGYSFHLNKRTLYLNGIPLDLTKRELDILIVFSSNLDQNVSYKLLREGAWENKEISTSTIRDTVSRLKKKASKLNIENVIGYGYILKRSSNL